VSRPQASASPLPDRVHPKLFLTSEFFARFLSTIDIAGKTVASRDGQRHIGIGRQAGRSDPLLRSNQSQWTSKSRTTTPRERASGNRRRRSVGCT